MAWTRERVWEEFVVGCLDQESVVKWVRQNYNPEEVYEEGELIEAVKGIDCTPDDVFDETALIAWAETNGFERKE